MKTNEYGSWKVGVHRHCLTALNIQKLSESEPAGKVTGGQSRLESRWVVNGLGRGRGGTERKC